MDDCQRFGREQWVAPVAGKAEPMTYVISGLIYAKFRQSAQNRNSLSKLNHVSARQSICQLRLASKEDLHQFRTWDLEVGKHAYRFQDRIVKVLRFVNHDHNAPAGAEFADQGVIQLAVHAPQVIVPIINAQIGHE